jgi:hypothetical protein
VEAECGICRDHKDFRENVGIEVYSTPTLYFSEDLKQVPQRLQTYIDNRHYLHAANELVEAVKAIFGDDLREIGALSEIRIEILEKKTVRDLSL